MFLSDATDVCMRVSLPSEEGKGYTMAFILSTCTASPSACMCTYTHTHTHTHTHTRWWNHRQAAGFSQEWQMKEMRAPVETLEVDPPSAWIIPYDMSWVSSLQTSERLSCGKQLVVSLRLWHISSEEVFLMTVRWLISQCGSCWLCSGVSQG